MTNLAGLTIGDPILRTDKPLSVELGPGIFNNIFDGIQRPLEAIAEKSNSVYIPRGIEVPNLDQEKEWYFDVNKKLKVGDLITGGDTLGMVNENELFQEHRIMAAPRTGGRITSIQDSGNFNVTQPVVTYEDEKTGKEEDLMLSHFWPVRKPREAK